MTRLLIVRHAIAEDREAFAQTGQDDGVRPLTKQGRRKMRRAARGLREVAPTIACLGTSPHARATETAKILAEEYGGLQTLEAQELLPDAKPPAFVQWLRSQEGGPDDDRTIAVVGHEPHLSSLVGWLLTGRGQPVLTLKKGAACLLQGEHASASAANWKLVWALTPAQLRGLRR